MAAEPTADGLRRSEAEARDGVYLAEARWEDADEAGEGAAEEAFTAALTAYREAVAARVRAEERAAAAGLAEALREIQWTSADEDSIDLVCVLCDGTPTTEHREFCSVGMALLAWDAQR